jgi:ubiquinone/menaquinone biosynthesis C-methylase UbiE
MPVSDWLLYQVSRRWPSPMAKMTSDLGAEPGSDEYAMAYARRQFDTKVRGGVSVTVTGLDVLEIGCGHGGITCYLAAVGARHVCGIDLNTEHLGYARRFAEEMARQLGRSGSFPVSFLEMSATQLALPGESFDLVMADNVFEHFTEPESVLAESFRVLRPRGRVLVPIFSSILSKYGLHLKHGLKLPWANVVFSERTIVRAMQRAVADQPRLAEIYPGLLDHPQRVRDVRKYKDLNDITFSSFKAMARRAGFEVESFRPVANRPGRILEKLPGLRHTRLMDICSYGASAILRKPASGKPAVS